MRAKLSIRNAYVKDKRVLYRVDWNVPQAKDGSVTSDKRIRETLPTIRLLLEKGAGIVCFSHLGRPKGGPAPEFSLRPVVKALEKLLPDVPVTFCPAVRGHEALTAAMHTKPGQLTVLENCRFDPGEEKNDDALAAEWSTYGDFFVNDAFGTCHRAHASVVGIAKHRTAAAGLLLDKELTHLLPLLELSRQSPKPPRPYVALLGGAKVSDKIGVLEALIPKLDAVLIGGAMAYTFLKGQDKPIGKSKYEADKVQVANRLLDLAKRSGTEVLLPSDHVCAAGIKAEPGQPPMKVAAGIPDDLMGLDIGPDTATRFRKKLDEAGTIIWNGPMGVFEEDRFAGGTKVMAQILAGCAKKGATVVTGGGETVLAAETFGVAEALTHISTGGGAFLELLEGKPLPGIAALRDAEV